MGKIHSISPVVKHISIRFLLSISVYLDLELKQLDVKTMFLHGTLEEEIYMEQPERFQVKGEDIVDKKRFTWTKVGTKTMEQVFWLVCG